VQVHNQPKVNVKIADLIKDLKKFNGKLIVQTLFLKGLYKGKIIDNTTPGELDAC
jgi:hypothetical protein